MLTAVSRDERMNGAPSTADAPYATIWFSVSRRGGPPDNQRTPAAPSTAWPQFVRYRPTIVNGSSPFWYSTNICAGRTASSKSHHVLVGTSSSAASTMALGGQITDSGEPGKRSENPNCAPR